MLCEQIVALNEFGHGTLIQCLVEVSTSVMEGGHDVLPPKYEITIV